MLLLHFYLVIVMKWWSEAAIISLYMVVLRNCVLSLQWRKCWDTGRFCFRWIYTFFIFLSTEKFWMICRLLFQKWKMIQTAVRAMMAMIPVSQNNTRTEIWGLLFNNCIIACISVQLFHPSNAYREENIT